MGFGNESASRDVSVRHKASWLTVGKILDKKGFDNNNCHTLQITAEVAQSVEQGTENPRVGGSIPPLGTNTYGGLGLLFYFPISNFLSGLE